MLRVLAGSTHRLLQASKIPKLRLNLRFSHPLRYEKSYSKHAVRTAILTPSIITTYSTIITVGCFYLLYML